MGHTRHTGSSRGRGGGSTVHNGQSKTLQTQISAEICTHQRGNDVLVIASMKHTQKRHQTRDEGEAATERRSEVVGGKGNSE